MDQLLQEQRGHLLKEQQPGSYTHRDWVKQLQLRKLTSLLTNPGQLDTLADEYTDQQLDLEDQATHDKLTGLLNFRGFSEALAANLVFMRQNNIKAYLAFLDIDKLKEFNDQRGKIAGNQLIQIYADVLKKKTSLFSHRAFLIGRFGGDECVILAVGADEEEMLALAETIRVDLPEAVKKTFNDPSIQRTVSIGITAVQPGDDVPVLFDRADRRLMEAKETRNRVVMR